MNPTSPADPAQYPYIIVTISDSNYVIPTYVLVLSLLRHQVRAMIHILGVGLSASPGRRQLSLQRCRLRATGARARRKRD